ncbi:anaerobic dimethyl sulfoxide reductase chain A [Haemophilus pittmaniae HK 85]|uniref:Anaerobic dimethyl sulfoxide reductase chain A n=1 Tax=Haemophilus pittmaniae HK 85 TaxID=1035188 RepID=F9QAW0_9PAST|nr:DMSO/selenate family reductase complex A subunit [Haemophilus pittmaniae]EGV05310.1 anaerobic dimethyl sulfoxide reductase chain A [Haemophilus pittmaniae HK 85]SNV87065.1 dimethyl sulfoxide reductase, anaerobic subunit A [Haemophilus pittmaniae]
MALNQLSRRKFLQTSSLASALAATDLALPFKALAAPGEKAEEEKVVWSACTVNCGSRCPLRMHVKDNRITYVETDNTGTETYNLDHQVRACLRGRSMRRRVYNPDRLKYPMKRVGKRGEGKFKRISWDEALTEISRSLRKNIEAYGNESIYLNYGTGTLGGTMTRSWPPGATMVARLMNCIGGYLNHYGDYSTAQIAVALDYTYGGGWALGNSMADIENTKLIVLFGNNPAETRMSGGGLTYCIEQAKARSNAKLIIIDPRYNDTGAGREDEWIPIRPGTDAALVAAMAYVMITENLIDKPFLDKYCVGFDEVTMPTDAPKNGHYKAYILGEGADGIAKTPDWASAITGIPASRIISLAREIATTKPAFIAQGWGPQRRSNGEFISRAIAMLPILTGNVGIHGGNTGARESAYGLPFVRMPTLTNPVQASIPMFLWTDAIVRGPQMTALTDGIRGVEKLSAPIKFIWNYASNCLINQHAQINRTHEILQDESQCEMIVTIDNHLTSTAKYSDILLPDCTASEQMDFALDAYVANMNYVIFADKVIQPSFECRNIYQMLSDLAEKLGVKEQFTEGRTQEEWLRHIYAQSREALPELPSFEEFRAQGIFKKVDPNGCFVAYEDFRRDPEKHPLQTPSGKIEIYSSRLAEIAKTWQLAEGDVIDPLPIHVQSFEHYGDPLMEKYPLQLSGFHYKARTHSTYGNVDVLQAANPQEMWINPLDAASRQIKDGDKVRIFNDRGEVRVDAKVTPRIMPGVVGLGEGAWHDADMFGDKIDHAGCINVLTTQRPSPLAKGNPQHSNLVQVERL